ncbi:hypothetical protein ACFTAO_01530 [Paenibacillus rhizoplanae]
MQTGTAQAANADSSWLNVGQLGQGVIGVSYDVPKDKKMKLMITKDNNSYTYNLYTSKPTETFPLQQGNGSYKVSVLENTTGNKYKVLSSETVSLSMSNVNAVYLSSVQNVKWSSSDKSVQKGSPAYKGSDHRCRQS